MSNTRTVKHVWPHAGAYAWLPPLALVFNAFTWGVSWWPFRQLEAAGLHPLAATVLIYLLAVLVISMARPAAWREVLTHPALWVLMLASGATNAAFNWAVTLGDVVRVVLLFYLMPLWAVLLARVLLHERLTAATLARAAVALLGALIILWPREGNGLPLPSTLAEWLGLVGGFSFALNNVMLRREAARTEAARALAMFFGGALVSLVVALLLSGAGRMPPLPVPSWGWIVGALALGALFLASNLALQYGAARLPANTTAVIMLSEVLFASVSALLLGAGELDGRVLLGGGAIIGAALSAARQRAPG
jgi:drug/metabolite transporter (DMT)-like permease